MDEAKGEHINEGQVQLKIQLKDQGLGQGERSVPNENFTQQIGFAKGSGQSVGFASCLGFYSLIERIVG